MEEVNNISSTQTSIQAVGYNSLGGWAKFVAVMNIIVGSFSCLGIITAAYGVPLIIAGIKLMNAVDDLKRYTEANDTGKLNDVFSNIGKYFKLTGIAYIVMICFWILSIVLYIIFFAVFFSELGDLNNLDQFEYNY